MDRRNSLKACKNGRRREFLLYGWDVGCWTEGVMWQKGFVGALLWRICVTALWVIWSLPAWTLRLLRLCHPTTQWPGNTHPVSQSCLYYRIDMFYCKTSLKWWGFNIGSCFPQCFKLFFTTTASVLGALKHFTFSQRQGWRFSLCFLSIALLNLVLVKPSFWSTWP